MVLLWLLFLTSFLFFRSSTGRRTELSDDLDDWSRWNENADLRRFLEQRVQDFFRPIIEHWPNLSASREASATVQQGQAKAEPRSRLIHLETMAREPDLPKLLALFASIETASSRAASSVQES